MIPLKYLPAKVAANNAMPSWVVLLVEFLLYVSSNVLLNVEFGHSGFTGLNGIFLHIAAHIGIFDNSLVARHGNKDQTMGGKSLKVGGADSY
ncbi:unnamed protein product [Dibothriocephalus latus]|uniref:Uncharacterized protein n=1 Tax=Dibothriocephalus latus TaxID=60516 RepID=A0A3P6TQA7_DIBLA|nr:unnamed protein product [Dibothriocephalus latus]